MDELDLLQKKEEEIISDENLQPDSEELDVESENSTGDSEEQTKKEIPLHTFLEEKRRRKELEKRIREFEQEKMSKDKVDKIEKIRAKAKEKGYDDDLADLLSTVADELYSAIPKSSGKSEDDFIIDEIKDAQEYGGLKDAMKYKDQILSRVKKNGLTIEEAYRLESQTKQRELQSEKKLQDEQIAAAKRRQASGDKAISSSSDSSKTESVTLSAEDRKLLEHLKRTMPSNNWTAEKLVKYKSMYT